MFPALPDYRRFAEATIRRIRRVQKQKSFDRPARMLFNVLLVAGLWGVPLYARWMILVDMSATQILTENILGRWRIGKKESKRSLEFTPKQLRLIWGKAIIESADYQIGGDVLSLFRFKTQPGDHDLEIHQQCYRISIRGDQLIVTPSDANFTPLPEHLQWEPSRLCQELPGRQGAIKQFQRVDDN